MQQVRIRIQLFGWDNEQELKSRSDELRQFSKLLGLDIVKHENQRFENTFFVVLPEDERMESLQINAVFSFALLKGHVCDFRMYPPNRDILYIDFPKSIP